MVSQQRLGWLAQLDADQLEASVLESGDDGGNQSSLDSVGLDGNEGSLVVGHCVVGGGDFFFHLGRGELILPGVTCGRVTTASPWRKERVSFKGRS